MQRFLCPKDVPLPEIKRCGGIFRVRLNTALRNLSVKTMHIKGSSLPRKRPVSLWSSQILFFKKKKNHPMTPFRAGLRTPYGLLSWLNNVHQGNSAAGCPHAPRLASGAPPPPPLEPVRTPLTKLKSLQLCFYLTSDVI